MFDLTGFGRRVCFGLKTPQCAAIVVAAMAAGCSADVTRFDSANFNLNDPPETAAATSTPVEPVRGHSDYSSPVATSTPRGPYGAGASSVDVAALPDPAPSSSGVIPRIAGKNRRPAHLLNIPRRPTLRRQRRPTRRRRRTVLARRSKSRPATRFMACRSATAFRLPS